MSEKKNVPKIRFPGFTDDWEQCKLGELYEVNNERNKNLIGYDKTFSIATMTYKDEGNGASDSSLANYKVLRIGDIAFEGHTNKEFRYGRFVANDVGDGIMSPRFSTLRPISKMPVSFWKYYIHYEPIMRKILVCSTKAGTMMNELVPSDFFAQDILVPSIEEQEKIGSYFNQLDNLITLHQRKFEALSDYKSGMLQKMFPKEGKKKPEFRFPGFIDDWEKRKLGDLVDYVVDNRGKNPSYYCEEGIPVIDNYMIKNVLYPELSTANRFVDENLYNNFIRKYCEKDDTLITLVGNGIGNITLFPDEKAVIIQNTLGLRTAENKRFLFFLIMAYNKEIVSLDRGMAQPSIRQDEILDVDMYVPKIEEQVKIGEFFSNLDNLITLHQRKCDELKEYKKGLLQQMFV